MSVLLRPFQWFYHEFGLASIRRTGRNAYLIIFARAFRMVAHGANATILALFFAALDFSDYKIGLFMTLTLLGDVFLGGFLTLIADRLGRRKVLIGGSLLMVMSGTVFATIDNFWILLLAAVVGVISATGGDFGPFRSIEESILSHLTTPDTRSDVLAWYVTTSSLGSAVGSEVSGRAAHYLQGLPGWTEADSYRTLFWSYSGMGLLNAILMLLLTQECEIEKPTTDYSQVPQEEHSAAEDVPEAVEELLPLKDVTSSPRWYLRFWSSLSNMLSGISGQTRKTMYKLWLLLAVDSIADGMVPYTLTNYYMDQKFHPSKATLGDVTSAAYLLGAISTVFAGPLARKIGLVNTMVFTHIPSSAAVLFFPLPPSLIFTIILLFIRAGLNNMDQAPRSAFIAGAVKPAERTAVMGITSMIRTLASTAGPTITGILAGENRFWIAFVAAGAFRLSYDIGLYALFINVKLHQYETPAPSERARASSSRDDSEDGALEMEPLDHVNGHDKSKSLETSESSVSASDDGTRLSHPELLGVRRRSPSPSK